MSFSNGTPAASALSMRSRRCATTVFTTSSYCGEGCGVRGGVSECVSTMVPSLAATTPAMSGSHSPEVSLTTSAPAARAASATRALKVSTEMTTSLTARIASTTGTMRSSSSASSTTGPRPNGTPPTSTQSAPSATARSEASTAASSAKVAPRSWKESGVRLTIAMTATRREKSNSRAPIRRTHEGEVTGSMLELLEGHRGVGEPGEVDRVAGGSGAHEPPDLVRDVPHVDVHAREHAPLPHPQGDELARLAVAADHHLGVPCQLREARVLHAEVELVGVEVGDRVEGRLVAEHRARGVRAGLVGVGPVLAAQPRGVPGRLQHG